MAFNGINNSLPDPNIITRSDSVTVGWGWVSEIHLITNTHTEYSLSGKFLSLTAEFLFLAHETFFHWYFKQNTSIVRVRNTCMNLAEFILNPYSNFFAEISLCWLAESFSYVDKKYIHLDILRDRMAVVTLAYYSGGRGTSMQWGGSVYITTIKLWSLYDLGVAVNACRKILIFKSWYSFDPRAMKYPVVTKVITFSNLISGFNETHARL